MNYKIIPLDVGHFEALHKDTCMLRMYRGEKHPYGLYLELNDIEHTKTKAKSPQTNGICERVHQTILNEFYRVAFRKKIYPDLDDLANRFG